VRPRKLPTEKNQTDRLSGATREWQTDSPSTQTDLAAVSILLPKEKKNTMMST
jgi:hypothetical protein